MDRMEFGKYRGEPIAQVPTGYLTWLLEQDWPKDETLDAVRVELCRRFDIEPRCVRVETPVLVPKALREHVDTILVSGFRDAALQTHPDHGGTDERMRGLIAARDWLARNLR